MSLNNKNILITGIGKGLGEQMTYQFIEEGAFIYGITRSKSDIKKFKHFKNIKTFHGDVKIRT